MKTNTNTLRRALETFAKTGKSPLTASALMALALTAPVNAAEKNFSESVIIEESTTVPAGDTYNYTVPEADAYNPIPGDLLEEPNSGLILNNGTLTIAGTANLTANFSSGSAVGDVSNLVIEKGGSGAALASAAVDMLNAYFSETLPDDAIIGENTLLP